jgi:hypothetical protein
MVQYSPKDEGNQQSDSFGPGCAAAVRVFGANGRADRGEVPATPFVDRIGLSLVTDSG